MSNNRTRATSAKKSKTSPPSYNLHFSNNVSSTSPPPSSSSSSTTTSSSSYTSLTWVNVYTPQHLAAAGVGASSDGSPASNGHMMIHSSHRLSTTYVNKSDKEKMVRVQKKGDCFMSDWQITKTTTTTTSSNSSQQQQATASVTPITKPSKTRSTSASTTTKRRVTTTSMHLEATPVYTSSLEASPTTGLLCNESPLLHISPCHGNSTVRQHQEKQVSPSRSNQVVEIKSLIHDNNKTVSTQECLETMAAALQLNSKSVGLCARVTTSPSFSFPPSSIASSSCL